MVIDSQTQMLLQDIVSRESRSLLSYIHEAFPWTTAKEHPALESLERLIRAEIPAVNALARFLLRMKVPPPFIGSYPSCFTTSNFISLTYLVPRLVEGQRREIALLEADLTHVTDLRCREQISNLLAVKKRTLAGLEALLAPHTEAASA